VTPFTRDITVNVIANLIAAFIVYLLGVFFGLFPSSDTARTIATTLLVGLVAGTALAGLAKRRGKRLVTFVTLLLTGGTYIAVRGLIWPAPGTPTWLGIIFTLVGAGLVLVAAFAVAAFDPDRTGTKPE
jgi:hypothetical protein